MLTDYPSLDLDPVVDFPESSWPADSKANPAGLSSAAYMNAWIRLAQIAGFALQTIVRYFWLVI
jgi:hypothetical protein